MSALRPHPDWIVPDWPAPSCVRALVTTRAGGCSEGGFGQLNLGTRCGDDPQRVAANRNTLEAVLPAPALWMHQVHGVSVADADLVSGEPEADAAVASLPHRVCTVLTADCLPVLLCDAESGAVGIAHAGWRGLAGGVIEATVRRMARPGRRLIAWLGPAISQSAYEVGPELRDAFVGADPGAAIAFVPGRPGKYHADLYLLARRRLAAAGIGAVYGGGYCTFGEPGRFFSFRRDGANSGRMASLIWLEP